MAACLIVLLPAVPASAAATWPCDIAYHAYQGGSQFTVNLVIGNSSTDYHINGWTLRFTAPPGQTVLPATAHGVSLVQVGQEVTGTNLGYNPLLEPGNRLWVGFEVKGPDYRVEPTAFTINGYLCSVDAWPTA
ncbi:cellulose binding domain-containing protein [Catenuloplanes sp. NPDC051500]|uniref:cellulose binding domain-containing protein n=1 Tax=Catenuloplanes sp. NPDC051500 TaxID=3363959 RepID=UPI0037B8AF94